MCHSPTRGLFYKSHSHSLLPEVSSTNHTHTLSRQRSLLRITLSPPEVSSTNHTLSHKRSLLQITLSPTRGLFYKSHSPARGLFYKSHSLPPEDSSTNHTPSHQRTLLQITLSPARGLFYKSHSLPPEDSSTNHTLSRKRSLLQITSVRAERKTEALLGEWRCVSPPTVQLLGVTPSSHCIMRRLSANSSEHILRCNMNMMNPGCRNNVSARARP